MKHRSFFSGAALLLLTGCVHDIHHAAARRNIDVTGGQSPAGSVEFYATGNDAVVPIYAVNKGGGLQPLTAVGLDKGHAYDYDRTRTDVANRLVVKAPTGTREFLIDGEGPSVKVPVEDGRVTPVQINYNRLTSGDAFVIYQADAHVLPATDPAPEPKKRH